MRCYARKTNRQHIEWGKTSHLEDKKGRQRCVVKLKGGKGKTHVDPDESREKQHMGPRKDGIESAYL